MDLKPPPRGQKPSSSKNSPLTSKKKGKSEYELEEPVPVPYQDPPPFSPPPPHKLGNANYDNAPKLPLPPKFRQDSEDSLDSYDDAASVIVPPSMQVNGIEVDSADDYEMVQNSTVQRYLERRKTRKKPRSSAEQDSTYIALKMYAGVDDNQRRHNDQLSTYINTGDLSNLDKDLKRNPVLTLASNDHGITFLEQAVCSGDFKMVELFINRCKGMYKLEVCAHALLYAIRENNYDMVRDIIKKRDDVADVLCSNDDSVRDPDMVVINPSPSEDSSTDDSVGKPLSFHTVASTITHLKKTKKKDGKSTWANRQEMPGFEDTEYTAYITPIVLAAQLNHQRIVQLLIQTDNCEIHPLTIECPFDCAQNCEICSSKKTFKAKRSIEESMRLIEIYKALASPSFIFNTADDPILEAFMVSKEMEILQKEDPAFKKEYKEINESVQDFAHTLLHLCRSTTEVKTLLAEEESVQTINTMGHLADYPRIIVALYYEQKNFIAHPYCQQILQHVWYSGLPNWVTDSKYFSVSMFFYILLWIFFWPFLCIAFIFKCCPQLIEMMKKPLNKFISDNISYTIFLALLISNAVRSTEGKHDVQGQIFSVLEILIMVWVFSLTCRQIKMAFRHRRTLCSTNCITGLQNIEFRWFDNLPLMAFWLWFILRLVSIIKSHMEGTENVQRYLWPSNHPFLIGEAFYAVGVILSFVRVSTLTKVSSTLGPLQISLQNMVNDILRFMVIFLIVVTAFVVAITHLYSNYKGGVRIDEDGEVDHQSDYFIGFDKTYKNLFWALFGYPEVLEGGRIYVDNSHTNSTNREVNRHYVTETFGLFMLGGYHCIAAIVMLNMLIAMMANSYNAIERNSDIEWKFARTRLRMTYHNEVGALPPPFNINMLGSVIKLIQKICGKCSDCCRNCEWRPKRKSGICNYQKLIRRLYKRYWHLQISSGSSEKQHAKKDDVQSILNQMNKEDNNANLHLFNDKM